VTAEECPHGMGDPDWCSICKHGPTKPEPLMTRFQFIARYEGTQCPECDLPIAVGQLAAKLSDNRTVHNGCAP